LSFIVTDNEKAVQDALYRGDYLQAFLLVHAVIESLLRASLHITDSDVRFHGLIQEYKQFLEEQSPGVTTFVEELKQFNRRRNRIVHELWIRGYTHTNRLAEEAAQAAVLMYGLFIEFLQTFDPELSEKGFRYDKDS